MYPSISKRAISKRTRLRTVELTLLVCCLTVSNYGQQPRDTTESKRNTESEKIYEPGGDVKRPKLVHYVEPQFSSHSKEAFVEGTVRISVVVTRDGVPTNCRVVNGLNAEEDLTAIEALKQWRFQPGTKSGQPVSVRVIVEIDFHLL